MANCGIITAMNPLAKLDQLNLEPVVKTEVAALIQSLIEQNERDAKAIQAKDATIHAKEIKIEALTYEPITSVSASVVRTKV